jgi:hypothetical protein
VKIGVVLNVHCSSSPHPEDWINKKHNQQIMAHDPSRNVPHFWRHEHTTFSGFYDLLWLYKSQRKASHMGGQIR